MANHKFRVGQAVDFNPSRVGVPASLREYKILRLLPHEGGEPLYRIKSIVEPFERIAKESELALEPSAWKAKASEPVGLPEKAPRAWAVRKNPRAGMPVRVLLTQIAARMGRPAATSSTVRLSSASVRRWIVCRGSSPRRPASSL
jgi:hypothetical protein